MFTRFCLKITPNYQVSLIRTFQTNPIFMAGFQGSGNVSGLMRQNQIDRKQRLIKKMEKLPARTIPILDHVIQKTWKSPERKRINILLTEEENEQRQLLLKKWAAYVLFKRKAEEQRVKTLIEQQKKALMELQKLSPALYEEAVKVDLQAIHFSCRGPVKTLPRKAYKAPLGGMQTLKPPYLFDDE